MARVRITEKTFDLIKGMLIQGYSVKKIEQMLPDEIKVSDFTIRKIDKVQNYAEYCGEKPEPKAPDKVVQITPHAQTQEVVDAINRTNILLESLFQVVNELCASLK